MSGEKSEPAPWAESRAVVTVEDGRGFVARDMEGMLRLARMVIASGLAPKGVDTDAKVVLCMGHGAALGLPPLQALQVVAPINGRVSIYGDAALALVRSRGLLEAYAQKVDGEGDARCAVVTATRKGGEKAEHRFSVAHAKAAGLWGKTGPWSQYPARMLMFRARSWVLRDLFGDVLQGMATVEEAADLDLPRSEYQVGEPKQLAEPIPAEQPRGVRFVPERRAKSPVAAAEQEKQEKQEKQT